MYIQLNGQVIYYEKTGEGFPIILLHGNQESHKIFDALIPKLSKKYTVYALDSRGHGASAAVKEFHYTDMAEDVAAFVHALDLVKPACYGFSDGGIIGLIAASRYPELFSALAVSGANLTPLGWKLIPKLSVRLHYLRKKDPFSRMMLKEPHITKADLSKITIPTLVLAGKKDIIKKKETKRIANAIPNASLKILSGENHFSYVVHSSKLYPTLDRFLRNTISKLRPAASEINWL